jgi:hypothetical protein
MESNAQGIATWQWVVSIIVIIALIVLGIYFFTGTSSTNMTPDGTTPALNTTGLNRLVVTDQFPGNIVFITTVQLAQPGFINITKDVAGQPGVVIGTQSFEKGINTGKVTLTEPTLSGSTYHAVLYYTDAKDTVLIDKTFKARTDLPEDKG